MKNLPETDLHLAIDALEALVNKTVAILGSTDTTHRGGWFCLANDVSPPARDHRSLRRYGRVAEERNLTYRGNAEEKVVRLLANNDLTSWRSRNPDMRRYGGGIRVSFNGIGLVMAFSGFPEHVDEALMLALAVKMKWLENKDAFAMAANEEVLTMVRRLLSE